MFSLEIKKETKRNLSKSYSYNVRFGGILVSSQIRISYTAIQRTFLFRGIFVLTSSVSGKLNHSMYIHFFFFTLSVDIRDDFRFYPI